MQDMKAYLDEQTDFGEYFALDRQFHIELIDSLQDPYFSSLKSSGMGFLNHPELQLNEKVPRQDVYACHEKILDAICKDNHSAAFDAIDGTCTAHNQPIIKALLLQLYNQNRTCFANLAILPYIDKKPIFQESIFLEYRSFIFMLFILYVISCTLTA